MGKCKTQVASVCREHEKWLLSIVEVKCCTHFLQRARKMVAPHSRKYMLHPVFTEIRILGERTVSPSLYKEPGKWLHSRVDNK